MALLATLATGLLSTQLRGRGLPYVVDKGLPDALYAVLMAWLVALVRPKLSIVGLAACAFACSALVELSQLYQADWIGALRATRLGGLALGHGFHGTDFFWYGLGAVAAAGIDQSLVRTRRAGGTTSRISSAASTRSKGGMM